MDQGYQMFKAFYLQPIETVAKYIARAGVRATTKSIKSVGHEVYKRAVKDPYEFEQAKKRKIMELELEKEYAQTNGEKYLDKLKTVIIPNMQIAGVPKGTTQDILKKIEDLAKIDNNPYETINDFGAIKTSVEGLEFALNSGRDDYMEAAIKNCDALYNARVNSKEKGLDEKNLNEAEKDFANDIDRLDEAKAINENSTDRSNYSRDTGPIKEKSIESLNQSESQKTNDRIDYNARTSDNMEKMAEEHIKSKTLSTRKVEEVENGRKSPEELTEIGSEVAKIDNDVHAKNINKEIGNKYPEKSIDKRDNILKDQRRAADVINKENNKGMQDISKNIGNVKQDFNR